MSENPIQRREREERETRELACSIPVGIVRGIGDIASSISGIVSSAAEVRRLETEVRRLQKKKTEEEKIFKVQKKELETVIFYLEERNKVMEQMEYYAPFTTDKFRLIWRVCDAMAKESPKSGREDPVKKAKRQWEEARNILNEATKDARKYFFTNERFIPKYGSLESFVDRVNFEVLFSDENMNVPTSEVVRFFIRMLKPDEISILNERVVMNMRAIQIQLMFPEQIPYFEDKIKYFGDKIKYFSKEQFLFVTDYQCALLTEEQFYAIANCDISRRCPLYAAREQFLMQHPELVKTPSIKSRTESAKKRSHHHEQPKREEDDCCLVA